MSSSPSTPDDPGLFDDLPLHSEEPPGKVAPPSAPVKPELPLARSAEKSTLPDPLRSEELSLLFDEAPEEKSSAAEPKPATRTVPVAAESKPAPAKQDEDLARSRLLAGLLDLGVVAAVAISAVVCVALMGVDLTPWPWAPMALFLTSFSFLYSIFPLAFWGRTPGMAALGLRARGLDGRSLSFGQTAWRWVAGLVTVLTFGLPLVLTLKGTYLSDLLSKSQSRVLGTLTQAPAPCIEGQRPPVSHSSEPLSYLWCQLGQWVSRAGGVWSGEAAASGGSLVDPSHRDARTGFGVGTSRGFSQRKGGLPPVGATVNPVAHRVFTAALGARSRHRSRGCPGRSRPQSTQGPARAAARRADHRVGRGGRRCASHCWPDPQA